MTVVSAGILLWRRGAAGAEAEGAVDEGLEVFIAHMGGPFWARKHERAWSIPKGELEGDEEPLTAARREFAEEIGAPAPDVPLLDLGAFRQKSGKVVHVFAAEADFAVAAVTSSTFELEWPPRSGRMQSFPEIDDARWVPLAEARKLLVAGQVPVLDALLSQR
jgi:predicted NUDIX family NTP pyrophosphohydrolase